jgi:hypothetical protein
MKATCVCNGGENELVSADADAKKSNDNVKIQGEELS